jgi:serine acetyltransferase
MKHYHQEEDYSNSKPTVGARVLVAAGVCIMITLAVIGGVLWITGRLE